MQETKHLIQTHRYTRWRNLKIHEKHDFKVWLKYMCINLFIVQVRIPVIAMQPDKTVFLEEDSVNLTCQSDGNPSPSYSWLKGYGSNETVIAYTDSFVIENANITDSGLYTCYTNNSIDGKVYNAFNSIYIIIGKINNKEKLDSKLNALMHRLTGYVISRFFSINCICSFLLQQYVSQYLMCLCFYKHWLKLVLSNRTLLPNRLLG